MGITGKMDQRKELKMSLAMTWFRPLTAEVHNVSTWYFQLFHQVWRVGTEIPVLQVKELQPTEMEWFVQGHTDVATG